MPSTESSDLQLARHLNQINQNFYTTIGPYFNHTRNYVWEGWEKLPALLPQVFQKAGLKALDIGCGNGRFLDFLVNQAPNLQKFVGIDNSEFLLHKAQDRKNLHSKANLEIDFLYQDILFDDWKIEFSQQKYDIVSLFGVMHHIPTPKYRLELLQKAWGLVAKNGFLVFTVWRYLDIPRLDRRVVDPNTLEGKEVYQKLKIDPASLATGDNILDWNKGHRAFRFSHYYTDSEIRTLTAGLKSAKFLKYYLADGKEREVNGYYIFQKI